MGYEERVAVGVGVLTTGVKPSRNTGVEKPFGEGVDSEAPATDVESNNPMRVNCPSAITRSPSTENRVNCNSSPGNISLPIQ